jgi:hypothetical protein
VLLILEEWRKTLLMVLALGEEVLDFVPDLVDLEVDLAVLEEESLAFEVVSDPVENIGLGELVLDLVDLVGLEVDLEEESLAFEVGSDLVENIWLGVLPFRILLNIIMIIG